jgi:hypothetical protein
LKVLSEVARLGLVAVAEHHAELLESVLGLSELVSSLQKTKRKRIKNDHRGHYKAVYLMAILKGTSHGMDLAYYDMHGQF